MGKEKMLALGGQVLIVVAAIFIADVVKSQLAKSKMTKPLVVKSE